MNLPSNDLETEQTLLGAVLIAQKAIVELGSLRAEHFYQPHHQAIWSAVRELDLAQQPVDAMTIAEFMRVAGTLPRLNAVGGRDYFVHLAGSVVTLENLGYHAARLVSMARRRKWLSFAQKLAVSAGDASIDTDEFNEQAEREALAMTSVERGSGGPRGIAAVCKDLRRTFDQRSDNRAEGGISGVAAGFRGIDLMTLGFQPEDLIVLAARPSMGKTALVCNAVANIVAGGIPALVFSFEMSDKSLAERMVSRASEVTARTLRTGRMDNDEWRRVGRALSDMSILPLEIDDRGGIDIHEIRSTARQWRARQSHELGIIVIDYMQLIGSAPGAGRGGQQNREREVAEQSRALKLLAKELKVPVVALSQLNRGLEARADKRPMMSDLRESGAIEQDADTVAFIYREVVYDKATSDPNAAEIIFAKQRNGSTGTVPMRWDGKTQTFTDAPKEE